ncbi:MAG: hypothetical protein ACOC78_00985 [Actinomycetota bacterium]
MKEIEEEWGKADVAGSNFLLAASVLSAAAGGKPAEKGRKPWFSLILTLYVAFMHLFLLRRVLCRNCHYYGRCCCTGWGKLAPLWGEKGDEAAFATGLTLPVFFWATYPVMGAGGILAAFRRDRDASRLKYLGLFILFFVTFNAWHMRRACIYCFHREECPKGKAALERVGNEVDL